MAVVLTYLNVRQNGICNGAKRKMCSKFLYVIAMSAFNSFSSIVMEAGILRHLQPMRNPKMNRAMKSMNKKH